MPDGYMIPTMSLKASSFNPVQFTAQAYTPQPYDSALLERTLANIETRQNNATNALSTLGNSLGAMETSLYNKSANQNEWWNAKKLEAQNEVQHLIDIGEYGEAVRRATSIAGNLASDTEVISRLKASKEYEAAVQANRNRIGASQNRITQTMFDYWLQTHGGYDKNIELDQYGNATLKELPILYDDISIASIYAMAEKMVAEDSAVTGEESNTINADGSGTGSSSQYSYKRKTKEDIANVAKELMADSDIQNQLYQKWEVEKFELAKLESQAKSTVDTNISYRIDQYKKRLYKNGVLGSYEDWLKATIEDSPYAESLSYNRTTNITGTSSKAAQSSTSTGGYSGTAGAPLHSTTYRGNPVAINLFSNPKWQQAIQANVITRFSTDKN